MADSFTAAFRLVAFAGVLRMAELCAELCDASRTVGTKCSSVLVGRFQRSEVARQDRRGAESLDWLELAFIAAAGCGRLGAY